MKKTKEYLSAKKPERVDGFMKGAQETVKFILGQFQDVTFYTPQNYDTENCNIMSYYKEEAVTPTFLYFMDGLLEQKM